MATATFQQRLPDRGRLVGRDALCADIAGEVDKEVSVHIILIQRKRPRVTFVTLAHDDLFPDVSGTD